MFFSSFQSFAQAIASFGAPKSAKRDGARVRRRKATDGAELVVGIDGEGHDVPCAACPRCKRGESCEAPRHIYTYLAAVDEKGELVADAYDPNGLSHDACCAMLLSIPRGCLCFGFMFSYDVTMILAELPPADIFYLMRPQDRDELYCLSCESVCTESPCPTCNEAERLKSRTRSVDYKGRKYDFFAGSLTIRQGRKETKVWDCFRFFGCAFVEALKAWKVGTEEQVARIYAMKQKRGALEKESVEDVQNYCREECHLLAVMMRKLKEAHEAAGIPLTRYDGAGSTASSLLRANNVASYRGRKHEDHPVGLARAIESAFFGGRFEDSVVGIVEAPVYGFDISSAYPFAQTHLPCLGCGEWREVERATPEILAAADAAVGEFFVRPISARERTRLAWGPLPFRDERGSIAYGVNFHGWAWAPELLSALAGWPDLVELTGRAWVYETSCSHKPFAYVPRGYRQRLEWGKEGKGLALKLGLNAGYGKTAQSLGKDPPFQSWPWAGLTTATTRGQLLDAIATARDRWNVLAVATDGIVSLERLPIKDPPRDTGTSDLSKPLGGWELKEDDRCRHCARELKAGEERACEERSGPCELAGGEVSFPEGMMIVKPGLYWRLRPTLKDLRARGIGRREAFGARKEIQDGFLRWDRRPTCGCAECRAEGRRAHYVEVMSRRFFGAKHSIYGRSTCEKCGTSWPGVPDRSCPREGCGHVGARFETRKIEDDAGRPVYGTWGVRPVRIGFDPYPKRERERLSRAGTFARLRVRDLAGQTSAPYDVGSASTTPEGMKAREARELELEQQDYMPPLAD